MIFVQLVLLLSISVMYAKPRVYDCFLFLNEWEILDIRLHEMAPVVDYFVIVEARETFRGHPKELQFPKYLDRFEEFRDQILYYVIDRHIETNNPWERETQQRNAIIEALGACSNDDVILISDVDEIVQSAGVTAIYDFLCKEPDQAVGVNQKYHAIYLNSVPDSVIWRGTVATTYGKLKETTCNQLRDRRYEVPVLASGWHFTYQGGIERELYKIRAFSHAELDTPELLNERIRASLFDARCQTMEVDDSFPLYIRQNQAYFEEIGFLRL